MFDAMERKEHGGRATRRARSLLASHLAPILLERMFDAMERLNPEQRAAVEHLGGPLLVVAGAGSGKTWTLACRVANLVCVRAGSGKT